MATWLAHHAKPGAKRSEHSLDQDPLAAADHWCTGPTSASHAGGTLGDAVLSGSKSASSVCGQPAAPLLISYDGPSACYGCGGSFGAPAPPATPTSASIWRAEIALLLSRLPGFERIDFAQGLLGAKSPKPTSILALHLPDLARQIRQGRVRDDLPQAASIRRDTLGRWQTTSLKEYPPAMCRALAASFCQCNRTQYSRPGHFNQPILSGQVC